MHHKIQLNLNHKGLIDITVYFDNASTTRVREEAKDIMINIMIQNYGNPSSAHAMGRQAKLMLDNARKSLATALGAAARDVVFTSGGTEADNWAILGAAETAAHRGRHMITALSEHEALRKPAALLEQKGWDVTYLRPDKNGRITAEAFAQALREDTSIASVMLVNNETGAISPIGEMTREIKRRGLPTLFHTDAVQGFMKIPFTVKSLGADLLSVSAHKLHGPKGIGALYIRNGVRLKPFLLGGGQEHERRAGTEALPAAAGFGEAVRLARADMEQTAASVQKLRDQTVSLLKDKVKDIVIVSQGDSPYILSLSLPGYKSEVLMNSLEADGVFISKSSACKKGARSHVLEAMRLPDTVIDGALRISFSRFSTTEEVSYFVEKLTQATQRLLKVKR